MSSLLMLRRSPVLPVGVVMLLALLSAWVTPVQAAPAAAPAPVVQPATATTARIKEVATVQGVRPNQLIGYGLVVGLDGTGDQTTQTPFTTQSLNAMLQQLGVTVPAGTSMQL